MRSILVLLLVAGCVTSSDPGDPPERCPRGEEGCVCYVDGSCGEGLVCGTSNQCIPGEVSEYTCAPTRPLGKCPEGEFCCSEGRCVPELLLGSWGCCQTEDCDIPGTLCSCDGRCINEGTCVCDADCPQYYECDENTDVCVPTVDCSNGGDADCHPDRYCDSSQTCRVDTTCTVTADCELQGLTGTFCSECGDCMTTGTCCTENDCTGQGEFCSAGGNCLVPPACDQTGDCRPGHWCNIGICEPAGDVCASNGPAACVESGPRTFWCCPTGNPDDCCHQGERCGADGFCIADGECIDDTDCLTPYLTCNTNYYECEPVNPCVGNDCSPGRFCSEAGACIPNGTCADDGDCPDLEVCNSLWECEPAIGCGLDLFRVSVVQPNMFLLIDRSSSMNLCLPCPDSQQGCESAQGCSWDGNNCVDECTGVHLDEPSCNGSGSCGWNGTACQPAITRLDTVHDALQTVLPSLDDTVRLGLSFYPAQCSGTCSAACGETSCTDCGAAPGQPDVPTDELMASTVLSELASAVPGGSAPLAPTLRAIEADRAAFGLPLAGDLVDRHHYLYLIINEDPGNGGTDSNCSLGTGEADLINCALDRLRLAGIRTFVIGYAFEGDTDALNCHAYYGGLAWLECPGIDATNCNAQSQPCYHQAENAAELADAFAPTVSSRSCNYSLDQVPSDADLITVYFNYRCDSITEVGDCTPTPGCVWDGSACSGEPVRVERGTDGWDYDSGSNQIVFDGNACDTMSSGDVDAIVIYGCIICGGGDC